MRWAPLFLILLGLTSHAADRPNILILFTDDQRWDALSASGNDKIHTPNLDSIAVRGTLFRNAFVTLSICSPSRAALLTGRYNSANGVTVVGKGTMNPHEVAFPHLVKSLGYRAGVTGKWHLGNTPQDCGFDFASICFSNQTWYDRTFEVDGQKQVMPGFVEDVIAAESVRFIEAAAQAEQPFVLWMCTQVPHMDHHHAWPAAEDYLTRHQPQSLPLTATWNDDLAGKPSYLATSRSRTQALSYGYANPNAIREHTQQYYASVEQMDAALGPVLGSLDRLGLRDNTWILFMGDNGWMLGEHGFTSKVLAYEASIRVPMIIAGPGTQKKTDDHLVLGIDLTATLLELTGADRPANLHGRSLLPLVQGAAPADWRTEFLYEAPNSQLGSKPLWAVRDERWKYIETLVDPTSSTVFRELYDLETDPLETANLAHETPHAERIATMAATMLRLKHAIR